MRTMVKTITGHACHVTTKDNRMNIEEEYKRIELKCEEEYRSIELKCEEEKKLVLCKFLG